MGGLQSTPSSLTPLDIGGIEAAQTPEEAHAATRSLLSEAKGIVSSASSSPQTQQSFVSDYNGSTENYSQGYTSQKQETGGALQKLKSVANTEQKNINYVLGLIEEGFTDFEYDGGLIKPTAENIKFTEIFYKEPYFGKILKYFDDNPDKVEIFVKNDLDLSMLCTSPEAVEKAELLGALLKEKYLESKNIQVSQNLENYFLNQTEIPDNKKGVFKDKINELRNIGAFEALSKELKSGECSLDYIEIIKDFNELHFGSLGINLKFTQGDAQSIIGSVIAVKKAENLVETLGINEQIINLTGIRRKELDNAIKSENPAESIGFLLAPYYEKHPKLLELEGQLFEQLDIKRELNKQIVRTAVVITQASEIYDMTDDERVEVKKVLMSTPPEEVKQALAKKIDEITQRPENLPYTPLRPEEQEIYREVIAEIGFTPEEASTLTVQELEGISTNEIMKKSFINMKTTLKDNNLDQIFLFRHQIFRAIGSLDFNILDGNYISENEMNIFLAKTIYATTGEKSLKTTPSNIDTTLLQIRKLNHVDGFSGQEDISSVGDGGSKLELEFRRKFAPKNAGLFGFKVGSFLQALKA